MELFSVLVTHARRLGKEQRRRGRKIQHAETVNHKKVPGQKEVTDRTRTKELKRENIRLFALTLVVWLLVEKKPGDTRTKPVKKTLWTERKVPIHNVFEMSKPEFSKTNAVPEHENEGSPWLLLAIIWYLAMIREQGFGTYSYAARTAGKKRKPKKRNKKTGKTLSTAKRTALSVGQISVVKPRGIIYAAG